MIIQDVANRDDLTLVVDSQDVKDIDNQIGITEGNYDGYLAKIADGDYVELYGFKGLIPELDKTLTKII